MEEKKILEEFTKVVLGEYGFALICLGSLFLFKALIENAIYGALFMAGSDFNPDDIVYIYGEKKARIVRITMFKTVFYIYDSNRKLVVPNRHLYQLKCEKTLPKNGENEHPTH